MRPSRCSPPIEISIYASLSQGEKQLLLIARSLMESPEILILDEATSGLDLFAREKLLTQIEQITSLPNAPTIIYVTHHAEEITRSFTHVLLLKKGNIIAKGPKNKVLTEEILSDFYDLYVKTVKRLRELAPKVEIVSHLINGLPGETYEMMVENVRRCVTDNEIDGIKLHLLHLMTSTKMQRDYHEGRLKLLSMDEYVNIICDQLEIIPKNIVIHRITGDAPRDMLIGLMWSLKKWEVLNAIDKEMERRGSYQGCKVEEEFKS